MAPVPLFPQSALRLARQRRGLSKQTTDRRLSSAEDVTYYGILWVADIRVEPEPDGPDLLRLQGAVAVVLAVAISALAERARAGALVGDPNRGETLYEACQDCHSLDKNDVGPRHRGVFGRKAASLPDYDYSDALKSANIVWNEETLDKWLTDPQAVAPGAKMFFHLDNPQDRADVIAYLKERAK
jgi:cytochrome c